MAKKTTAIAPRTPEMVAELTSRANQLTSEIHSIMGATEKGFLSLAPLMAEVRERSLYTLLGYKNIDEYGKFEHGMSHGTIVGLNKVYSLFGSTNDDKTEFRIPEQYLKWGYTKLLLFADEKDNFKSVGIDPLEQFTSDMTIKEMRLTLANALQLKIEEQEKNAIDTTATDVENPNENNENGENPGQNEDNKTIEARKKSFEDYIIKIKETLVDLSAFAENEPQEVITVVETISGYVRTLEKTYNKAHATATPKKNK